MFPWWSHGKKFGQEGSRKFKNTRRKGTDQENLKKQGKIGRKKKKRCVLHWLGLPFCDPPLRRTTRMGISPTTYFY